MLRLVWAAMGGLALGLVPLLVGCPSLAAIGVEDGDATRSDRIALPVDAPIDLDARVAKTDVAVDACDANFLADPANCGACDHDCLGGACAEGVCSPVVLFTGDTPSSLALDGTDLLVTVNTANPTGGYVFRCTATNCQESETILAHDLYNPWFSVLHGDTFYWVDNGGEDGGYVTQSGNLASCPPTGCPDSGPTVYTPQNDGEDGGANLTGLAVDSTYLYWAEILGSDSLSGRIDRCAAASCMTTLVHLVNGAESIPYAVAVDSSYVYWTDLGTNQILRCALPSCGGNPEVFANDLDAPTGITIFKGTVYWTNGDETAGSVLSCPTSGCGSGPTTIASSQENPYAIAVDDSGIYWTNLVGGTVMHCPRVGCTRPSTLAHAPGAFAIALDAESVYFTTALADGQVLRVAK